MSTPKGGYPGAFSFCFPGPGGVVLFYSGEKTHLAKSIAFFPASYFSLRISLDNFAFLFPGLENAQPKKGEVDLKPGLPLFQLIRRN